MKKLLLTLLIVSSSIALFAQDLRYFVDADATGNETGVSWTNAFTSLQDAVDSANAKFTTGIIEIWVAEGTYKPVNQSTPFTLSRNIHIYGGFTGTEAEINERDFRNNLSVIDGDINGDDNDDITVNESTRSENAYCLFRITGFNVILDGLVLQGANGSNNQTNNRWNYEGSAIFFDIDAFNGQVRNCKVRNNSAIGSVIFHWAGANNRGDFLAGRFISNEIYNNYAGTILMRFTTYSSASTSRAPDHTTILQNNLVHSNTVSPWVNGATTCLLQLSSRNYGNLYSGLNYVQSVSQNTFVNNNLDTDNGHVIRHFQQTTNSGSRLGSQFLFITDNIFSNNGTNSVMFWDQTVQDKQNTQFVFVRNLIESGDSVLANEQGSFAPSVGANIYGEAPGFTDPDNDDYTITGCDNPGNDMGGSWINSKPLPTDFYGNTREVGVSADIGHAEVQQAFTDLEVEQDGSDLVATAGYEPYKWYNITDMQNVIEYDETGNRFTPPGDGDYAVLAQNGDSCGARADIYFCSSVQVELSIEGDSLKATGKGGTNYTYRFEGQPISQELSNTTDSKIELVGYGEYEVTHFEPQSGGCAGYDKLLYCGGITEVSISENNKVLTASVDDAEDYTWYFDDTEIQGETSATLDLDGRDFGSYYVEVSENACSGKSKTYLYTGVGIGRYPSAELEVYPNPTSGTIKLKGIPMGEKTIIISNVNGKEMKRDNTPDNEINISEMPNGIYLIQIHSGNEVYNGRIVKQ